MKKLIVIVIGIFAVTSTLIAANIKGEKAAFEIDTKASKVYWTGKKVTGEHTGYVEIAKGKVWVEKNNLVGAEVKMDLNAIVCNDLKDEQWNKKLVDHLKSDDFFSVEKYPDAKFEITSVTKGNKSDEVNVKGNLTMKGTTHEISFPSTFSVNNETVSATGTATIDRTKWNIQYSSGKFFEGLGDKMIYDEFEITFDISAKTSGTELSAN